MLSVFGRSTRNRGRRLRRASYFVGAAISLAVGDNAGAQELQLLNGRLKDRANGILSLMANSMVPDLASSNLSIKDAQTENPSVFMT
ncbi:MAG: hypothetical protein JSS56_13035, partial [Proteobacteria bacterium]|nr:hypothetical protein [Pseudomonadota bacterium]